MVYNPSPNRTLSSHYRKEEEEEEDAEEDLVSSESSLHTTITTNHDDNDNTPFFTSTSATNAAEAMATPSSSQLFEILEQNRPQIYQQQQQQHHQHLRRDAIVPTPSPSPNEIEIHNAANILAKAFLSQTQAREKQTLHQKHEEQKVYLREGLMGLATRSATTTAVVDHKGGAMVQEMRTEQIEIRHAIRRFEFLACIFGVVCLVVLWVVVGGGEGEVSLLKGVGDDQACLKC
ncbi:hypothetical protein Slin15195_G096890 [Septoria linicola]|uniref:Uncharacterized protein n=1 Tax=Septoria linicola TaxID=215465 RepID=A0A9Q9EMT2_9PEZI|nr:hypothetical protein Slin14017_G059980 [Septoria linicola]USW56370.1 hypothetical protein Slin15195_G096890 [Septoria linicola]